MEAIGGIWLQLTLLLTLAVASHFIATKLRMSMIIPQIVIGIMIGPSLFGIIMGTEMVSTFAHLGSILLLFMVGLECDFREIFTPKNSAVAVGGVIIPWIGGFALGTLLGLGFDTAIMLGAILCATSIAVKASVLMDLGIIKTFIGKTIIGAAVIDDVLAMVVLSLCIGIAGAAVLSFWNIATHLIYVILFIVIGATIGAKYFGRLVMFVERKTTKVEHTGFMLAIAITFLYAVIADAIGISAIVGAFIAGAMFSKVPIKEDFLEGTRYIGVIFIPVFFMSIGILIDIRSIVSFKYIILGLLLTIVAIITKIVGCGLPARLFKMSRKESLTVGVAMVPRCEVTLIIALYALTVGIFNPAVYSIIVIMVIITTLGTPPALKRLLRKVEVDRQKKLAKIGVLPRYRPAYILQKVGYKMGHRAPEIKDVKCIVCLDRIKKDDDVYMCKCGTIFHKKCVWHLDLCPACMRKFKE
jgi:Kef-type K+ transport system membrane component KefB